MFYQRITIEGTLIHRTNSQSWLRASNLQGVIPDNQILVDEVLPGKLGYTRYRLETQIQDKPKTSLRILSATRIEEHSVSMLLNTTFTDANEGIEHLRPVAGIIRSQVISEALSRIREEMTQFPDATWGVQTGPGNEMRIVISTSTYHQGASNVTWYRLSEPSGYDETQQVIRTTDFGTVCESIYSAMERHAWFIIGGGLDSDEQ